MSTADKDTADKDADNFGSADEDELVDKAQQLTAEQDNLTWDSSFWEEREERWNACIQRLSA